MKASDPDVAARYAAILGITSGGTSVAGDTSPDGTQRAAEEGGKPSGFLWRWCE